MFLKKYFSDKNVSAIGLSMLIVLICSCSSSSNKKGSTKVTTAENSFVDTTVVPHDTVAQTNHALTLNNGVYFFKRNKFSGIILAKNSDKTITAFTSIYKGEKHGLYRSYYNNGKLFEVRQYKNNMATGRHYGYYRNGNMQFDYLYFDEKKVGYFKKWFSNGSPYLFANYKDDKEEGLQQGWRPNGKLFLNYVAKDGRSYGLQETMLCYTLKDEELKSTAIKK